MNVCQIQVVAKHASGEVLTNFYKCLRHIISGNIHVVKCSKSQGMYMLTVVTSVIFETQGFTWEW
jgi:hypothetical protein